MAEKIRRITIELENGLTREWVGRGSVNVVRTGAAAKTAPVLLDDDVSYVSAVLVFDRDNGEVGEVRVEGPEQ